MKEKLIASFLAALMVLTPVGFAASALKDYPAFLTTDPTLTETSNSLEAYVVVGSGGTDPAGLASDIAGAIDLALRLTEMSYTKVSTEGVAAGEYDGVMRDGVKICVSASTSTECTVVNATSGQTALPGQIKNTHYSGLKDTTISWRSSTYSIAEEVDVQGVYMRHSLTASNINGTNKMVIGDSDVKYEYVFKTTMEGTGTPGTPNYTYPISIQLLGKDFTIVGADTDSILMLTGSVCNGVTATIGCTYGDYTVYAPQGGTTFTQLQIVDADGNTVDTLLATGWSSGSSVTKTSSATSLDITVTTIAALQDGTIVGVDVVVGPTGTTTHDYDGTSDVESTGTANEAFDTDNPRWGIEFVPAASGQVATKLATGSKIRVVYKPSTTEYYVAGEKISLPNNYGDLGFEGWNTDNFATITVKQVGPLSVYNSTSALLQETYLYGIEITSDTTGVLRGGSDYYEKAYVLFNASNPGETRQYPVVIGWYDKVKGKTLVSDNWLAGTTSSGDGAISTSTQYAYAPLSASSGDFSYAFVLNNGEKNFYINITVANVSVQPIAMYAGDSQTSTSIDLGFRNYTSWDSAGVNFEQQFIKLGATTASAESVELNVTTEAATGSNRNAGTRSREIVDDTGLLIQNPSSNGASDAVVFKVPSKALSAKLYFGKKGAAAVTEGETIDKIVAITTPIAVLDSEVTSTHKAKNLILVGGPCVNSVLAELATALTYDYTCDTWPARNFGFIKAVDDAFTTGKVAVTVAGTRATDTRTATEVLMKYDTLLTGETGSAVEVTAATSAGITSV